MTRYLWILYLISSHFSAETARDVHSCCAGLADVLDPLPPRVPPAPARPPAPRHAICDHYPSHPGKTVGLLESINLWSLVSMLH